MTRRLSILLLFAPIVALMVIGIVRAVNGEGVGATAQPVHAMGETFDGTVVQSGRTGGHKIAIVPIVGTITSGDSSGGNTGGDTTVAMLKAIDESGDYSGVILEMDTPGGGVLPSAEIASEVRTLRAHHIRVVSWMRDLAASGGYYVSAGADRIVASRETITGSIGVIFEYANLAGLADKVGIKPVVVKSGKLKDIGSPYRDLTPEERDLLQRMIDEAYDGFVKVVADGRHMSEAEVRKLADGRIYTGLQGSQNGLVDELGLRDTAYDAMADLVDRGSSGSSLRVVRFQRRLGFWDALAGANAQGTLGTAQVLRLVQGLLDGSGQAADPTTPAATVAPGSGSNGLGLQLQYRAVIG